MKRLLPLVLLFAVLIAGCDKGTIVLTQPDPANPIVGDWKQQSEVVTLFVSGAQVAQKSIPVNTNNYVEFRSTGVLANYTYVIANNYTETDGTFASSNNNTTLSMTAQGYTQSFQTNFTNSNNTVTLTGSGVSATGLLTYTINGVTYQADAATAVITMTRM